MNKIKTCTQIAVYGIGTETERFLSQNSYKYTIVGLLDGFRETGEIYGYPIIPLSETIKKKVEMIIVVARPGSCKAIAKRIGSFCTERGIELFDVRGRNLLEANNISYDFSEISGNSRQELLQKIEDADVISFDLFDTLITRKVFAYTDIFELLDLQLRERGMIIPNFASIRLHAEKELSKNKAPHLEEIYQFVLNKTGSNFISAVELADMEWNLEQKVDIERKDVCEILKKSMSEGKTLVITTDTYYSRQQIEALLGKFELANVNNIFVSCEYGTSKTLNLFEICKQNYANKSILHIGDDEFADVEKAIEHGIESYRVYSGVDLYDSLGGLGLESEIKSFSDRIKVGMLVSNILNSPFWFEKTGQRLSVSRTSQIGYSFCAPMVTDFVLWLKKKSYEQGFKQILFGARDGYLPVKLFRQISPDTKSVYFLTSRTAAIRAGIENNADIEYVDSMKFFGSQENALSTRFGIYVDDITKIEREKEILKKAETQKKNYGKYIEKLDLWDKNIGMFDFVAKGTTQLFLQKLFIQHIKGYYFLQLEPEFMLDKGLDIEPFYSEEEKNDSVIFDNYYILETILTSPSPQLEEFDEQGEPVFAKETRSKSDIKVFEQAQEGIISYFEDYLSLIPEDARIENKKLDEKMLELINKIQILDDNFMNLKVEDPFFGRMTDIRNVIG